MAKEVFASVEDIEKNSGQRYLKDYCGNVTIIGKGDPTNSEKRTMQFQDVDTGARKRCVDYAVIECVQELDEAFPALTTEDGNWVFDRSEKFYLSVVNFELFIDPKPMPAAQLKAEKAKRKGAKEAPKKAELSEKDKLKAQLAALES